MAAKIFNMKNAMYHTKDVTFNVKFLFGGYLYLAYFKKEKKILPSEEK